MATSPAGVAPSLRGKRIFITGATGSLGRALVEKLLWSTPEAGKLLLLIRAGRDRGGEDRLRQDVFGAALMDRLRARHGDDWEAWLASRVEAVPGDIGLDRSLQLNTRGAGRTLALARDAGDAPLLHVSTCFVSGKREGPGLLSRLVRRERLHRGAPRASPL